MCCILYLWESDLDYNYKRPEDSSSSWDLFGLLAVLKIEVYLCIPREGGEMDMENWLSCDDIKVTVNFIGFEICMCVCVFVHCLLLNIKFTILTINSLLIFKHGNDTISCFLIF